jgi:hypothetical protein
MASRLPSMTWPSVEFHGNLPIGQQFIIVRDATTDKMVILQGSLF